jgi:glutathionylspermidine synthase
MTPVKMRIMYTANGQSYFHSMEAAIFNEVWMHEKFPSAKTPEDTVHYNTYQEGVSAQKELLLRTLVKDKSARQMMLDILAFIEQHQSAPVPVGTPTSETTDV